MAITAVPPGTFPRYPCCSHFRNYQAHEIVGRAYPLPNPTAEPASRARFNHCASTGKEQTRSIPKATIPKWSKQDTLDTNFPHVPALSLVVAGDICYHDVHQWLVEATSGCLHRRPGIDCGPETGYRDRASHERPDAVDGISNVRASINKYIRAFGELKEMSTDAAGLYQAMIRRYINAIKPVIL